METNTKEIDKKPQELVDQTLETRGDRYGSFADGSKIMRDLFKAAGDTLELFISAIIIFSTLVFALSGGGLLWLFMLMVGECEFKLPIAIFYIVCWICVFLYHLLPKLAKSPFL